MEKEKEIVTFFYSVSPSLFSSLPYEHSKEIRREKILSLPTLNKTYFFILKLSNKKRKSQNYT